MKPTLKLKLLIYLEGKIAKVPKDGKLSIWLTILSKIVIIVLTIEKYLRRAYLRLLPVLKALQLPFTWLSNVYFVFIESRSQARVFEGWCYRWFAVKYANKRFELSKVNKYCCGKRHYAIEFDSKSLIVINKLEMNKLKARRIISKNYNVLDVFHDAYYVTK